MLEEFLKELCVYERFSEIATATDIGPVMVTKGGQKRTTCSHATNSFQNFARKHRIDNILSLLYKAHARFRKQHQLNEYV